MTGYLLTAAGERWQLPPALDWEVELTRGAPCDSFTYRCPCLDWGEGDPRLWHRFEGYDQGALVFRGVVDECTLELSSSGGLLEVNGRGLAALLLDNEALPQDYQAATLGDILREHVSPYGVEWDSTPPLPQVNHFSVASGESEWSVLSNFLSQAGGTAPRLSPEGRLVLTPPDQTRRVMLGDGTAVTHLAVRHRRYGVLSQVWVRDRFQDRVERVTDQEFMAQGGCARRVFTAPGREDRPAMAHRGRQLLEQSAARRLEVELEVPQPFWAYPGELVEINRSLSLCRGLFQVESARSWAHRRGVGTSLVLRPAQTNK